jgi:hypothetical protein
MEVLRCIVGIMFALVFFGSQAFAQSVYMFHAWDNQGLNLDDCIGRAADALRGQHFKITFTNEFADGKDVFGSGRSVVVLIHCVRIQSGVHAIIITSGANSKVAERTRDEFRTKLFGTLPPRTIESPAANAKPVPGTNVANVHQNRAKSPQQFNSGNPRKGAVAQSPKKSTKHFAGQTSGQLVGTQTSTGHSRPRHLGKSTTETSREMSVKILKTPASTGCRKSEQVSTECRLQQKARQQLRKTSIPQ